MNEDCRYWNELVCQYLRKYKSGYSFRIEKAINEGKLKHYEIDKF